MSDRTEITFRKATREDLPYIVRMLANDEIGRTRENAEEPMAAGYLHAFDEITDSDTNELIVGVLNDKVVAVLQVTYIPNLTYQGGRRAMIEGVHVAAEHRSQGIGRQLINEAINRAKARNCRLVQLTTDKARTDAKRFYESLGFVASHEGMKLKF